jgi:hypothetical protein
MKREYVRNGQIGLVMVVLSLSQVGGLAQREHPTQPFMRLKLNYSQGILEGITLEKYDLIVSNATLLRNMSLTNAFLAMKSPDYLNNITHFQSRVDSLIKAAKEKSLENSTEAYSQVVSSCVACHKQFRREQFLKNGFVPK